MPRVRTITVGPEGGFPALLLPGNDQCAEFYRPLGEALGGHQLRTTLLTLPGFHGVPPLPEPGWPAMIEAASAAVRSHLGDGGLLIGHSLGAFGAVLTAAEGLPAVRGLVLLEPALPPVASAARLAAARYERDVIAGDRSRFTNWSGSFRRIHDESRFPQSAIDLYLNVRRTSDPATARALVHGMQACFPMPFHKVAVPTLVIRGGSSGTVSRIFAWTARLRLPDARLEVIPGGAHWLANEVDQAVATRIAGFLESRLSKA